MIKLKFNRKYVPLVAPFVARADIRYYLNGIHVEAAKERPGVYVVGCDGHRLTIAYDREGMISGDDGKGVTMRMPHAFVTACKARGSASYVIAQDKRISVGQDFDQAHEASETYVMAGNPWIEGKYPDIHRVLPSWIDLKPGFCSQVDPRYLADFAALSKSGGVSFWQAHPSDPIVVQHTTHPELLSILMPRRSDEMDLNHLRGLLREIHPGARSAP
jgi:hypothetical protein